MSVVIPTLNSAATLQACLEAVRAQDNPAEQVEIVIADAGSTDETLAIASELGVEHIVANPLKSGEAGKAVGIRAAQGNIIALVDSDNVLDEPEWLRLMLEPLADPDILACEPIEYTWRRGDPPLTRYFALLGMNDPLCLFLGNYDRMCAITGKWTGLDVKSEDCAGYLKLTLEGDRMPTIGANGFVFRRELLDHVTWEPYFFDIDVMHQAVAAGFRHVAKVKCGIVHLYCRTLKDFARKQDRRIRDFLFYSEERQRTYPWNRQRSIGILLFVLATATVLPLLVQMAMGWRRKRDWAWLYHIPVCWITLWVYGKGALGKALGIKPKPKSRASWQR